MMHQRFARGPNQILRMQRQAVARANAITKSLVEQYNAENAGSALRQQALDRLQRQLQTACEQPLDCSAQRYAAGAVALFFGTNWTSADATEHVVFQCNTRLPGSQRAAAAFVWADERVEALEFERDARPWRSSSVRLFVFLSTIQFTNGDAYAVFPATFAETEGGRRGYWTFATMGSVHNRAFFIGPGGMGTFLDHDRQAFAVTRPGHFDDKSLRWYWFGRSSISRGTKLEMVAPTPFNEGAAAHVRLLVPPSSPGSRVAAIACVAKDDAGDPLGIVDTADRPTFGLIRAGGRLFFYARPNQRDQHGKLLFAGKATARSSGGSVFEVPFVENGVAISAELAPNHRDPSGNEWFIQRPNATDKAAGLPLVWIALDVL